MIGSEHMRFQRELYRLLGVMVTGAQAGNAEEVRTADIQFGRTLERVEDPNTDTLIAYGYCRDYALLAVNEGNPGNLKEAVRRYRNLSLPTPKN